MRRTFHRQMPCMIDESGTMKAGIITIGKRVARKFGWSNAIS